MYSHYVPKGTGINAVYTVRIPHKFLNVFRCKRPTMAKEKWFQHWDRKKRGLKYHENDLIFTNSVHSSIKTIPNLLFLPDLIWADFFLFPMVKALLSGDSDFFYCSWNGSAK